MNCCSYCSSAATENASEINIYGNEYDDIVYKIVAIAIDKYPSILKRLSNVELYYLCENFLERDKYNNKKRSMQETADKLISFAKGECIDVDDVKQLKSVNFQPFEQEAKKEDDIEEQHMNNSQNTTQTKKLGEGQSSKVYAFNKKNILRTKHNNKQLAIALSHNNKINHMAYSSENICIKILLSLFARQTKYYTDFIMKTVKGDKKINENHISYQDKNYYNRIINAEFQNISNNEKHKEIAREFLFSAFDHNHIDEYNKNGIYDSAKGWEFKQPLCKNRLLDKNGKIVDIDLSLLDPMEEKDFNALLDFVKKSKQFDLPAIYSNLKKNLTISPKLIAYHTLMELKKYKFKYFNDKEHANYIKYTLKTYQSLLSATKENFKNIDKDIVKICEKQLKLYDEYIAKIDEYSLKDFEKDFKEEQEQITSKINKYRSMQEITQVKPKKEYIPFKACNNAGAKNNNEEKGFVK